MDKPAPVAHDVHDLIRARWSPRAFADRPIDDAALRSLLESARWAASCFNEQPWRFIVARRDTDDFNRLLECLVPGNQVWANRASVLMVSVARMTFTRNDKPNRHAFHDVGLAVSQLSLQATSLGIVLHQMAGFDRDKVIATYKVPEGFEPVTAIALGYPGDPEALADDLRERELAPRSRMPQKEFVFTKSWGHSLD